MVRDTFLSKHISRERNGLSKRLVSRIVRKRAGKQSCGGLKAVHIGFGLVIFTLSSLPFIYMDVSRRHAMLESLHLSKSFTDGPLNGEGAAIADQMESTHANVNQISPGVEATLNKVQVDSSLIPPKKHFESSSPLAYYKSKILPRLSVEKMKLLDPEHYASFLNGFNLTKSKASASTLKKQPYYEDKTDRFSHNLPPSKKPCKGVFLFIAVREDAAAARQVYRESWLNPSNWVNKRGGTKVEDNPSMDYRFFLAEGQSEPEFNGQRQHRDQEESSGLSQGWLYRNGTGHSRKPGSLRPLGDTVLIPRHVVLGLREESEAGNTGFGALASAKAGGARLGGTSSTQKTTTTAQRLRAWQIRWVMHLTEFNFILLVDTGYSAPLPPKPLSESTQVDNIAGHVTGSGYSLVCVERIADELRFRPLQRFAWTKYECAGKHHSPSQGSKPGERRQGSAWNKFKAAKGSREESNRSHAGQVEEASTTRTRTGRTTRHLGGGTGGRRYLLRDSGVVTRTRVRNSRSDDDNISSREQQQQRKKERKYNHSTGTSRVVRQEKHKLQERTAEEKIGGKFESQQFSSASFGHALWPQRPMFQAFSQDVAEMIILIDDEIGAVSPDVDIMLSDGGFSLDQQPREHRYDTNQAPPLASAVDSISIVDLLLHSLLLVVLDDQQRIQNASAPSTEHAATVLAALRGGQPDPVQFAPGARGAAGGARRRDQKARAEHPCKAFRMFSGLRDSSEVKAIVWANGNRTKIIPLGSACDASSTLGDIGLYIEKLQSAAVDDAAASISESSLLSSKLEDLDDNVDDDDQGSKIRSKPGGDGNAVRLLFAVATALLEVEGLFSDIERTEILRRCTISAPCLWSTVSRSVIAKWWQHIDSHRASRCLRKDVPQTKHLILESPVSMKERGAGGGGLKAAPCTRVSCDRYKDRRFMWKNGGPGKSALSSPLPSSQTRRRSRGAVYQGRQEEGQKAVTKSAPSGAVLASFPGSGNTWSRMLLEYASGIFTGSIYNDITLMPVLPAEGVRTEEVLVWKAHTFPSQYVENYNPAKVVLLVRHPIKAIWSEFQRRQNIEVGSHLGGGHVAAVKALTSAEKASFRSWSNCMSCRWLQYITAHLQLAQVLPLKLLLFERLVSDPVAAIREVLLFLEVPVNEERLHCAPSLADHPLVHRPKANFTVFEAFPTQACVILRTIEQHEQGRLIMSLLANFSVIRTARLCDDTPPNEIFSGCADMLTQELACELSFGARAEKCYNSEIRELPPKDRSESKRCCCTQSPLCPDDPSCKSPVSLSVAETNETEASPKLSAPLVKQLTGPSNQREEGS